MGIGEKFIGLFIPVDMKPKNEKPKKQKTKASPIETGSSISTPKRVHHEESPGDNTPDFSDLDKIE